MLLISTLAAHDLGYINLGSLVERLERTFDTFDRMQKRWGHFYNWYDTRSLQTLSPEYISTVDSGNLLACLIVLKQGLLGKTDEPLFGPRVMQGLADTLALVAVDWIERWPVLGRFFDSPPGNLAEWASWLEEFERQASEAVQLNRFSVVAPGEPGDREAWAQRLLEHIKAWRDELAATAPWLADLRACERLEGMIAATAHAGESWATIRAELLSPASVTISSNRTDRLLGELARLAESIPDLAPIKALMSAVGQSRSAELRARLRHLAGRAEALASAMDFRPLYRPDRHLFTIGFNVAQGRPDSACYDLLASEACLTSYLAVARCEAPRRHWFQLGRHFIRAAGRLGLISWGGTMFEYAMPRLMLRSLPRTVLTEAVRTAVARQIEYGKSLGLPWGISESSYSDQNPAGDYHNHP